MSHENRVSPGFAQNFRRVLAWTEEGEEVSITMRREEIARLVPRGRKKVPARPNLDLKKRLERVFGTKVIPDTAMARIMDNNKGSI